MSSSKAAIIAGLVGLMAGAILTSALARHCFTPEQNVATVADTLVVRDTIIERRPVYVTQTKTDTMLVSVRDTVTVRDTAYVVVEREQRHYHGDDYDAWVSGWRPALDSIMVYPETRYITSESISVTSRKRWGIGLQAGYGVVVSSGQIRAFPYIGVGVSYNFIRF
mgnify:CR=1 FL=1